MICVYCECDIPEDQIHKIPGSCLQVLKQERSSLQRKVQSLQERIRNHEKLNGTTQA